MNYYEELDVSRFATTAEINTAYRALVRILHPDQQSDTHLRKLSELQLVRLNEIANVLTNPERRRQYDTSLDRMLPVPLRAATPRTVALSGLTGVRLKLSLRADRGAWVWALVGVLALGTTMFWFQQQAKEAALETSEAELASSTPNATAELKPTARHTEMEPAPLESNPTEPQQTVEDSVRSQAPAHAPVRESFTSFRPADGPRPSPSRAAEMLEGRWLYSPKSSESAKDGSGPQSIELQMSYGSGLLWGKYLARYKDSEQAVPAEVNFKFEGQVKEPVSVLPWSSPYGSRGEIRLKRISNKSLEVTWMTTQAGQGDRLGSGSAVLYRADP